MGRRPELKSDEVFEGTPISSRDNILFVFETAEKSGSVIGGATPQRHRCRPCDSIPHARTTGPRLPVGLRQDDTSLNVTINRLAEPLPSPALPPCR